MCLGQFGDEKNTRLATYLAIIDISPRVQDDLVGDDLYLARLEGVLQVELWVLSQSRKGPVDKKWDSETSITWVRLYSQTRNELPS